jgi:hypothetical protein
LSILQRVYLSQAQSNILHMDQKIPLKVMKDHILT